jgi:hypothetical protein
MNDSDFDALEEMSQQQDECEAELYYAILDALQTAKNLGLETDKLKTLCYATGIDYLTLEN